MKRAPFPIVPPVEGLRCSCRARLPLWQLAAAGIAGLLAFQAPCRADEAQVVLRDSGGSLVLKVDGDKDDDWWIQGSTNLVHWGTVMNFGTILSGNETNAPWRALGTPEGVAGFYRALKTKGLYDPAVFRTISLTFTQANWATQLANGRAFETNAFCSMVTLNNGATNFSVGARYKGNTSYTMSGTKKSINLEFDAFVADGDLMNYSTVNLNNAFGDETLMREPLFFAVMSQYTPCPKGAMARVHINGSLWGVYSLVQQENGELIDEWFPSNDGDRWRAPNAPVGGFTSSNSAFCYFNTTNLSAYTAHYTLKTSNSLTSVAWQRLINAIQVLNTTPANQLRDKVEDVFAVDNWLWNLAIENLFVDDDSYWNKGADYGFYYEPESGRVHPVEHDGNEAFAAIGSVNYSLSPVQGASGNNRPLLYRLLSINELRQRYLAHMRTVLQESFNPAILTPMIGAFHSLSIDAIIADPNKGFTMAAYTNDLVALRRYVTNRYNFLMSHPELTPLQPDVLSVSGPADTVYATNTPFITAQVAANGASGLGSVWLYHRGAAYGRFTAAQMSDDGLHGDGAAGDGVFGAVATSYPAGTRVRYYIEARGSNAAQAARFSPARAERETYSYRVGISSAGQSPVILNEFMADNVSTITDGQAQYEDWIELRNVTDAPIDLAGCYLSDETNNPRKWQFPAGSIVPAGGYLLVWADEDTTSVPGLHASFKLSKSGEQLYLADTDANFNAILDSVVFGTQVTDLSYGRSSTNADAWIIMAPSPGVANE